MNQLIIGNDKYKVNPIYNQRTTSIKWSETYSTDVDSIQFWDLEAELIIAQPYETRFLLCDFNRGIEFEFFRNDCTIEPGKSIVTVGSPKTLDALSDLSRLLDSEVNIIDLGLISKKVSLDIYPAIQIWTGGNTITSIINGIVYHSDVVNQTDWSQMLVEHQFAPVDRQSFIVQGDSIYSGNYTKQQQFDGALKDGGGYQLIYASDNHYELRVADFNGNGTLLFRSPNDFPNDEIFRFLFDSPNPVILNPVGGVGESIQVISLPKFVRVLFPEDNSIYPLLELTDTDLAPPSPYYKYVVNTFQMTAAEYDDYKDAFNGLFVSEKSKVGGGKYGTFDTNSLIAPGDYFDDPETDFSEYYPINQINWKWSSTFFGITDEARSFLEVGRSTREVIFYDFVDMIEKMSGMEVVSQFLEGTSPFKDNRSLWITPLSNLLVEEYDRAATRQLLKLQDPLNFLEFVYNLFIRAGNTNLVIEHHDYFNNGGSYVEKINNLDLSKDVDRRNKYEYRSEKITYDKSDVAPSIRTKFQHEHIERYEANLEFTGLYTSDQPKDRPLSRMNVDIMSMILNAVSFDGTIVIELDENDNIIFEDGLINGGLAMDYCNPNYHLHNCNTFTTNYGDAKSVIRIENESLKINIDINEPNKLIKTKQGYGKIKSVVVDKNGSQTINLIHNEY